MQPENGSDDIVQDTEQIHLNDVLDNDQTDGKSMLQPSSSLASNEIKKSAFPSSITAVIPFTTRTKMIKAIFFLYFASQAIEWENYPNIWLR